MVKSNPLLLVGAFLFLGANLTYCQSSSMKEREDFIQKLGEVPDSIKVGQIEIKNLFKSQILAHEGKEFDSLMIVNKVYMPHSELWDNCYGIIMGEHNASKFNNPAGMVAWNKTLYPQNKEFFDERAKELLAINIDSAFKTNLEKFNRIVPFPTEAKISILFTPLQGVGFGGCSAKQFCFELNNTDYNVAYTMEKGIPHELNHFAFEPLRRNDPSLGTPLFLTIDEGFACYFTWLFFDKKITKFQAVEAMSEEDWNWYLKREKEIFELFNPYFEDHGKDIRLLQNSAQELFPDAPKTLYYWLGFRIIEKYVNTFGEDSWKDIYNMNVKDVLVKSGYKEYINGL